MAKTLIFLVILALLSGLNGCIPDGGTITTSTNETGNEGTFEGLSAETERQMKRDYVQTYLDPASTTADDIQIYYYFGNYNGYEVVAFLTGAKVGYVWDINGEIIYGGGGDMLFSRVVYGPSADPDYLYDATGFQFPQAVAMLAWKPGENSESGHFYAMQEAYNLGLLTRNDIQSMSDLYYDLGPFEDLDQETKTRIVAWSWDNEDRVYYGEELFEDLDDERRSQLVYNFWNRNGIKHNGFEYLGTYRDYVILSYPSTFDGSYNIFVYDFEFLFTNWTVMYAWHKGDGHPYIMEWSTSWAAEETEEIYYEIDYKEFLTAEDAKSMWERYIYGRRK